MADEQRFKLKQTTPEEMEDMITGGGFKDTGRRGSFGEKLDSMLGVPARTAIAEAQEGNFNLDALKKILGSVGNDPEKAPTAQSIVDRTGIDNPYLAAGLATAIDVGAQLPMGLEGKLPGAAGAIKSVAPSEITAAFPKLQKSMQVGNKTFGISNAAEGEKIKQALEKSGALKPTKFGRTIIKD